MNAFEVALASQSYREGHAYPVAQFRHRRLLAEPLAIVLWQLGAEPFTAAAIGFGTAPDSLTMVVAGEPRNRDLAFRALLEFARWFNPRFEAPGAERESADDGGDWRQLAVSAPQVVVANPESVEMLGRLGRRLAYLPVEGPRPADPSLVRLGQHLSFLHRHASRPGQQLIAALTDVLNTHWITAQSSLERQSLAALDAFIAPPAGVHGYRAAAAAERDVVGPLPDGQDEEALEALVSEFNRARAGSTDPVVVDPLLDPIRAHYDPLVERTWKLVWRCFGRESAYPEAASVEQRWTEDRAAYTAHLDWLVQGGRRRTRQDPRQAAMTLRRIEGEQTRLEAEEALDDPIKMIPYLMDNKAIAGCVVQIDLTYRERATTNFVTRPLVTIASPDPCLIPPGRKLWWTKHPSGAAWVVHAIAPTPTGGSLVTLKLLNRSPQHLPERGEEECFSVHQRASPWLLRLPEQIPWTHQPDASVQGPRSIDEEELP